MHRSFFLFVSLATLMSGCSEKLSFVTRSATEFFVQDFNPPYLDVLWVVDDRSPMGRASSHIVSEAKSFFQRLDASSSEYRMAFTTADMAYNRGALRSSAPITKLVGDLETRTNVFGTIFENLINLRTGGLSQGIGAALTAIQQNFHLQPGVPLVIVFISDSYDVSDVPEETASKLEYFREQLLSVIHKKDLIRIYSINYVSGGERCATLYDSDIDSDNNNRGNDYDLIVKQFSGDTGNLCGNFSTEIDLSGLRLKELPSRFKLKSVPDKQTQIILTKNGAAIEGPKWRYNPDQNEIVFDHPPEEGATIQVIFN